LEVLPCRVAGEGLAPGDGMEAEAIAAPANPRRSRRVRPRDWYAEDSALLDFIDTALRLQASQNLPPAPWQAILAGSDLLCDGLAQFPRA